MQIATPVFVLVVATAALTSLAVACTTPTATLGDGSTNTDNSTAAKPKAATTSSSSSSARPSSTDSTASAPPAVGVVIPPSTAGVDAGSPVGSSTTAPASAEQCVNTCVASDPKAIEILGMVQTCMAKCGQNQPCAESCVTAVEPTCQTSPASCITINNCETSCSTGPTGTGTTTPPPATVAYAQVQPIIANACGQCHATEFSTLAQVKASRSSILGTVGAGVMPLGQPGFAQTPDGQTLLTFLNSSPDLQ
jgi:hypothetical protein